MILSCILPDKPNGNIVEKSMLLLSVVMRLSERGGDWLQCESSTNDSTWSQRLTRHRVRDRS